MISQNQPVVWAQLWYLVLSECVSVVSLLWPYWPVHTGQVQTWREEVGSELQVSGLDNSPDGQIQYLLLLFVSREL